MIAQDTPAANFLVVVIHGEYEKTVRAYIDHEAALTEFQKWDYKGVEVYLAKIERMPHGV